MPDVSKGDSLSHAFVFYKDKHKSNVSKKEYRDICCAFNKKIVDVALTGRVVKLPFRMGEIWIKKIKTNWDNPPIDLNESKKQGKTIYHLNMHSDGWWARWYWTRTNSRISNVTYYSFDATRDNSRAVAKIMKTPGGYKRFFS